LSIDGVPPYIARSPEEWFDPETHRKPRLKVYDDEDDMMHFEVCSPDRTVVLIYDRPGQKTEKR
jgi:hypothetical protein